MVFLGMPRHQEIKIACSCLQVLHKFRQPLGCRAKWHSTQLASAASAENQRPFEAARNRHKKKSCNGCLMLFVLFVVSWDEGIAELWGTLWMLESQIAAIPSRLAHKCKWYHLEVAKPFVACWVGMQTSQGSRPWRSMQLSCGDQLLNGIEEWCTHMVWSDFKKISQTHLLCKESLRRALRLCSDVVPKSSPANSAPAR